MQILKRDVNIIFVYYIFTCSLMYDVIYDVYENLYDFI